MRFYEFRLLFSLWVLWLTVSCSYQIGNRLGGLPGGHESTYVSLFENKTNYTSIEMDFVNALKEEFFRSQKVKVRESREEADTYIIGRVDDVGLTPGSQLTTLSGLPQNSVLTTSYRLYVTVTVEVVERKTQKTLWKKSYQGETVYFAPQVASEVVNSLNATYNDSAVRMKIAEVSKQMMKDIHDQMLERF